MSELLSRMRALRGRQEIDAFLDALPFPATDGDRTVFAFHGAADAVELVHWIFGLESSLPFERIDDTDLWVLTLELPEASRIEYKLVVTRGDTHRLLRDPLNPHEAIDPFGSNSVCQTPGYESPAWIDSDPEARPGMFEDFSMRSRVFGGRRRVRVYLPPRYRDDRRYPLIVIHDGRDYVRFASLKTALDNLVYRNEMEPPIVALTQSPNRMQEYAADPSHAAFLAEELLPRMEDRYPLRADPRERALMGASLGAVAALHAAWARPGLWGRLLLQSGSFAFTDIGQNRRGPTFDPIVRFVNAFRAEPGRPAEKIFVSCGRYESLIYENRSIVPVLQRTGARLRYVESRDGHNWENWRDRLREGLSFVLPGPLWMVYE